MTSRTVRIIDAADQEILLDGTTGLILAQNVNVAAPPPAIYSTDEVYGVPGARLRSVRHATRKVSLPIHAIGDTAAQRESVLTGLFSAIDPYRGSVTIEVTRHDGGVRQLSAYLSEPPQIVERTGSDTVTTAVLVFDAFDPYWRDANELTVTIEADSSDASGTPTDFDDATVDFDSPTVPFDGVGAGTLIATAENDGDVSTYPRWEVDGPADSFAVQLVGSDILEFTEPIPDGSTLVIDTDPACACVTLDGVNKFGALSARSQLWWLPAGTTSVAIKALNMDGGSLITGTWTPRYLTS